MPLSPNSPFGHYEIRSLLGKGGMGEVYLAYDNKLRRQVAIKLLPSEFTQNKARLAALSGYPIKRAYYAWRRQVEVHLDRQAFTIVVIHHVEGAKATITPQRITHKVRRPTLVDCFRHHQR